MVEEDAAALRASSTTRIEPALRSSDPDRVLAGESVKALPWQAKTILTAAGM